MGPWWISGNGCIYRFSILPLPAQIWAYFGLSTYFLVCWLVDWIIHRTSPCQQMVRDGIMMVPGVWLEWDTRDMANFMGPFVAAGCSSSNRNGFSYKGQTASSITSASFINLLWKPIFMKEVFNGNARYVKWQSKIKMEGCSSGLWVPMGNFFFLNLGGEF